jgi:hypothetical protein
MRTLLFLCFAALITTRQAAALNLQQFTQCIGPQGTGPVCQLDAGTYPLSQQLLIARSNITIKGTIQTSNRDTTLQRAPGWQYSLLIDIGPPLTLPPVANVTIRDLTFDGNKAQTNGSFSYFGELYFSTTKSVLIANCNFINSPSIGLVVLGRGASGVVVNASFFSGAGEFGMFAGASGNSAGYLGCANIVVPDDVIVANSQFYGVGENAIYASATHLRLLNDIFTDTHTYFVNGYTDFGGQVDLDPCTDTAAVVGNNFQGSQQVPGDGHTQGIELHGTNISVVNNIIQGNWDDGIALGGAANVLIANWDSVSLIVGNEGNGIAIHQGDPGAPDSARPVDFVTIDHVRILNNFPTATFPSGIVVTGVVPVDHLAITNNCLVGNGPAAQISLSDLGPDNVTSNNLTTGCGPN